MDYGVSMFPTDYAIRPDDLAREVEARGFESLWFPEHTHIPASRRSPWPGGSDLPRDYWHTYDLFVALTAAAVVTNRLKLGSGICLVVERDPIVMAKEIASVDRLSNGRLLFGVGGGWNVEEMENHGTSYKSRWRLMRERILAMKEIWTQEEASFQGEFVKFDRIWSHPKPVQKPHPPIIMGGDGPTTLDRVIEYSNGWMPLGRRPEVVKEKIAELRQKAEKAGRDPRSVPVTIFGAKAERRFTEEFVKAGASRIVFMLPSVERDKALPMLDAYAKVVG